MVICREVPYRDLKLVHVPMIPMCTVAYRGKKRVLDPLKCNYMNRIMWILGNEWVMRTEPVPMQSK